MLWNKSYPKIAKTQHSNFWFIPALSVLWLYFCINLVCISHLMLMVTMFFLAICRYRNLVAKVNYQVDKRIWDKIKVIYIKNRHIMEIEITSFEWYFCFDQLIVVNHVNDNVEIERNIMNQHCWDWITL